MSEYIRNQILGIADNFKALAAMAGEIEQVARVCADTLKAGNKIMFCGNGGSAADSQHLAAELVGRYKLNRPAMNALALTVDTSILTAVGNDYGYETDQPHLYRRHNRKSRYYLLLLSPHQLRLYQRQLRKSI